MTYTSSIVSNSKRCGVRLNGRSRILATSFFRQLKSGGLSDAEIISISGYLVEFLTEDLKLKSKEITGSGTETPRDEQEPH